MGKVFKKAFRILGFDKRKGTCRWVVEQDFHGNFQVNVIFFFPLFSVSLTELCSFWYGLKDLFTLHKLADVEDIIWPCGDTKFCISKRPCNVLFII